MAFKGLGEYVKHLEAAGDLIRITCFADPELEITEIADRMVKSGRQALLFENNGTGFPLLINAFASDSRMAAAIGRISPDEAGREILSLVEGQGVTTGLFTKIKRLPYLAGLLRLSPRMRKGKGACQEVISHQPDLSMLPVLKCWPYDGGRFITLPLVHTKHPGTGKRNLGMYRMQIMDNNTTGMHWHRHKTGAKHYQAWKEEGRRMPVTVTLGGDPVYTYAATAPMPENIDEYLLAGFLRRKRVTMVRCLTNDLWVPEDSDIVIEGYVDPFEEPVTEGPFGDHTGFYSLEDLYPRLHVTCVTHRRNAVYPATIVGVPPMEDAWFGKATEKIFLAPMKLALAPEIRDLHMPVEGVAHNLVLVSVDKSYPGQGMKVLNSLFGAGQMMFSKYIAVLSGDVNLRDYRSVAQAILRNVRFSNDLMFTTGPLDVLDHSSDTFSRGSKMGIDATVKMEEEGMVMPAIGHSLLPESPEFQNDIITGYRCINDLPVPVAIVTVGKPSEGLERGALFSLLPESLRQKTAVIIAVDHATEIEDLSMVAWLALGNSDPVRDIKKTECGGLFIDATSKYNTSPAFPRSWPNVVCSDRNTVDLVDKRWQEYKTGDFIASSSLKLLSLVHRGGASAYEAKR